MSWWSSIRSVAGTALGVVGVPFDAWSATSAVSQAAADEAKGDHAGAVGRRVEAGLYATSAVLGGVALVAATNFWNPVGWVATAVMVGGYVAVASGLAGAAATAYNNMHEENAPQKVDPKTLPQDVKDLLARMPTPEQLKGSVFEHALDAEGNLKKLVDLYAARGGVVDTDILQAMSKLTDDQKKFLTLSDERRTKLHDAIDHIIEAATGALASDEAKAALAKNPDFIQDPKLKALLTEPDAAHLKADLNGLSTEQLIKLRNIVRGLPERHTEADTQTAPGGLNKLRVETGANVGNDNSVTPSTVKVAAAPKIVGAPAFT